MSEYRINDAIYELVRMHNHGLLSESETDNQIVLLHYLRSEEVASEKHMLSE